MKIRILKSTVADGRFVKAGRVEDISDRDAVLLLRMGKAEAMDELLPPPSVVTTETVEGIIAEKSRRGRPARLK